MKSKLVPGIVSVTFRNLPPERIVELAAQAGLAVIEWGSDVHVPPDDQSRARQVRQWTEDAGLKVASYGSYYIAGTGMAFAPYIETALTLGAPNIRIWAGKKGSAEATEADWRKVVEDAAVAAEAAAVAGLNVSFEYHGGTLTDTREAASRLMAELSGHRNLYAYWQPDGRTRTREESLADLRAVALRLSHVHVFVFTPQGQKPLADGEADWAAYFAALKKLPGHRYAMLEFVKDGSEEQLLADAAVLHRLLQQA